MEIQVLGTLFLAVLSLGVDTNEWRVSTEGIGPVKIGMTLGQVNRRLHGDLIVENDLISDDCYYMRPQPSIEGLTFMVSHGRITRIEVRSRGIKTISGVQVGDNEAEVIDMLGPSVEIFPHKYLDSAGNYLTVWASDRSKGVRFETFEGKIIKYYSGRAREVGYTEGCS